MKAGSGSGRPKNMDITDPDPQHGHLKSISVRWKICFRRWPPQCQHRSGGCWVKRWPAGPFPSLVVLCSGGVVIFSLFNSVLCSRESSQISKFLLIGLLFLWSGKALKLILGQVLTKKLLERYFFPPIKMLLTRYCLFSSGKFAEAWKMRGKPKKAAPKGGAKRHISHIKRTNQKRNKLVKQGKAKPLNSTPRYIPNQAKKAQQENTITPWQPSEQEVKGRYPQLFFFFRTSLKQILNSFLGHL